MKRITRFAMPGDPDSRIRITRHRRDINFPPTGKVCDFKAANKASLNSHVHSTHESTHDCNVCDFKATDKVSLERHIQSTHEDDITSTQNMISDARARREIKSKSKRINCDKCQMRFNKEQTFQAHMKKVHGDKIMNQLALNN